MWTVGRQFDGRPDCGAAFAPAESVEQTVRTMNSNGRSNRTLHHHPRTEERTLLILRVSVAFRREVPPVAGTVEQFGTMEAGSPGRRVLVRLLDPAMEGLTASRVQPGSPSLRCELLSRIGVLALHLTVMDGGLRTIGRKQSQLSDSKGD